jgi:hypothetical protein
MNNRPVIQLDEVLTNVLGNAIYDYLNSREEDDLRKIKRSLNRIESKLDKILEKYDNFSEKDLTSDD